MFRVFLFERAKVRHFFELCKCFWNFFVSFCNIEVAKCRKMTKNGEKSDFLMKIFVYMGKM